MSEYNAKIYHEQGGSVLRVESGGSIAVEDGGAIAGAGHLTGACITATTRVWLGSDIELMWGTLNEHPVFVANPGSIFIRSDGSMSNLYVNITVDNAGSVWGTASKIV